MSDKQKKPPREIPADSFCRFLAANVDNEGLSDAEFRAMVRRTLPAVIGAETEAGKR